jgi:hypothetical protein
LAGYRWCGWRDRDWQQVIGSCRKSVEGRHDVCPFQDGRWLRLMETLVRNLD